MTRPRARRARPTGREQVKDALLEAATQLFAERGPGAVSAREIARRARVNHGLVHRHFGSKDALVRAVLDRLVDDLRTRFSAGAAVTPDARQVLVALLAADRRYVKVLTRAVLDGHVEWLEESDFPVIRDAIAALPHDDAPVLVASYVALALGWLAFEPFIVAATGLSEHQRAHMADAWNAAIRHIEAAAHAEPREFAVESSA